MQVYVLALICGLLVYWLELTYYCVLFDSATIQLKVGKSPGIDGIQAEVS